MDSRRRRDAEERRPVRPVEIEVDGPCDATNQNPPNGHQITTEPYSMTRAMGSERPSSSRIPGN